MMKTCSKQGSTACAVLALAGSLATSSWAQELRGPLSKVDHSIAEAPSLEDAEWPIVFQESRKASGGEPETTVTVRHLADPSYSHTGGPCGAQAPAPREKAQNCNYAGPISIELSTSYSGVLHAHLKHYAYWYCADGDCSVYDPYKVERWWTRSNSSYSVRNAKLRWGCAACKRCDGGDWTYVYRSSPITPGWAPGNRSHTYRTTITWFVPMQGVAWGGDVRAVSESDVYQGSTYKARLELAAPMP